MWLKAIVAALLRIGIRVRLLFGFIVAVIARPVVLSFESDYPTAIGFADWLRVALDTRRSHVGLCDGQHPP